MSERSYPGQDGTGITEDTYEALLGSMIPSGLIGSPSLSDLVYADSTGRQVKVRASRSAVVRGFHWETDGAGIVRTIDANTSGSTRIDLAVLRLNRSDWTVTFQIIKGTPAATPVAPSLTQTIATTGVWELPLAEITVANGAVTLAASNVAGRAQYIGGWTFSGNRAAPPGSALNPQLFYAYDAGRMYAQVGTKWQIVGESGALTAGSPASGWTVSNIYYRRWNGFTWMQAVVQRTGANLAANADSPLFTIPAAFRPLNDMILVGYAGGTAMTAYLDADSGVCTLQTYTIPFQNGAKLYLHPVTYPGTGP